MYLLAIQSLAIPKSILIKLPDAIAENCAMHYDPDNPNIYCEYFFAGAPRSLKGELPDSTNCATALKDAKTIATATADLADCVKYRHDEIAQNNTDVFDPSCFGNSGKPDDVTGKIDDNSTPQKLIGDFLNKSGSTEKESLSTQSFLFVNDPAAFSPSGVHSYRCFKQALLALLALDMAPAQSPPSGIYKVRLDIAEKNPRYLADLTQQSFKVVIRPTNDKAADIASSKDDATRQEVYVCKKADDLSLGYSGDPYVQILFGVYDDSSSKTGAKDGTPTRTLFLRNSTSFTALQTLKANSELTSLKKQTPKKNSEATRSKKPKTEKITKLPAVRKKFDSAGKERLRYRGRKPLQVQG